MLTDIKIRTAEYNDVAEIYNLITAHSGLDINSEYFYHHMLIEHRHNCAVIHDKKFIHGFCISYFHKPNSLFIWQLMVGESVRGQGFGWKIVDYVIRIAKPKYASATVTNKKTKSLFCDVFSENEFKVRTEPYIIKNSFIDQSHSEEILVQGYK